MFSLEKWWDLNGAETRSHLLWEINSLTDMQISLGRFQVYLEENVVEAAAAGFTVALVMWFSGTFAGFKHACSSFAPFLSVRVAREM